VDSDLEWEEEEPGENLSDAEVEDDADEEKADDDEEDDGFFVPHGYLSEGEGCEDDDDDVSGVSY
jgi:chromatin assembly factor 1 subunit A